MAKPKRKNTKAVISAKESKKATKGRTKTNECISCLLELHKLQGILLKQLTKEI